MSVRDVFTRLGGFHVVWSYYETLLEIIAMKQLGLSFRQAHIVFGTLNARAKEEVVIALLKDAGDQASTIEAIQAVPQIAGRNHLTHSLVRGSDHKLHFNKRELKSGLRFKRRHFSSSEFEEFFQKVCAAIDQVAERAQILPEEAEAYSLHAAQPD